VTSELTTQQLDELKPLAHLIAEKVATVPVRHCPGGTDMLVAELVTAVAVYMGRTLGPHPQSVAVAQAELDDEDADEDGCWEWTGARDRDGYGVKKIDGRQWRVHRLAYMEATGEDPGELHVLHSCDNPPCYRPSHLRLGTNADNVADKVARGRSRNQYTDADACIYGHVFTPDNVYVNPTSGSRQCRTCRRLFNALDKKLAKAPKEDKKILREIFRERMRQDFVFGWQNHPDGTGALSCVLERDKARQGCENAFQRGAGTWMHVLIEEVFEAFAEEDPAKLRAELIQVAAVAAAWIAAIDRQAAVSSVV
jgi:hypothetical protein